MRRNGRGGYETADQGGSLPAAEAIPVHAEQAIAAGEVPVKREPGGRRHRVYVMLDGDPLGIGEGHGTRDSALAVAQERILALEEQLGLLQEQIDQERQRSTKLVNHLRVAQEGRGPWWRFWQSWRWVNRRVPPQDG